MQEISHYVENSSFLPILVRFLIVIVMATTIGYNRERKNQIAGVRTHVLVAIGSFLSILLPYFTIIDQPGLVADPFRLSAQVISGIGFLGAGTIIKSGQHIKGLTTAASLWVIAIISITVGAGYTILGIVSYLVTFSFLTIYDNITLVNPKKYAVKIITVKYHYNPENKLKLLEYLEYKGINRKYEKLLSQKKVDGNIIAVSSISIRYKRDYIDIEQLIEGLITFDFVTDIRFNSELDRIQ